MAENPVSVQDVLGAAGEPPRFAWRGKEYKVGFPTQRVKARLEELIAGAETAAVQALRGVIPPTDFADQLARLGRQLRTREHRTRDGSLWQRYMVGEEAVTGFQLFLLALLREHQPDVTEDDLRAMLAEGGEFLLLAADRVVPGFFTWLEAELGAPKGTTAELAAKMAAELRRLGTRSTPPSSTTP